MHAWRAGDEAKRREEPVEDPADRRIHEDCLRYLADAAAGEVEGLFGPDSVTWQIWREPLTLVSGLPAVLCQLAHPAVASGVARFSNVRQDPVARARNTMTSLYALVFGDLREATATCRALYARHRRISGHTEGGTHAGAPYRANDQRLLRWVALTTAHCGLTTFELLVRPLTRDERERWVGEARLAAVASGVAPDGLPADWAGFERMWLDELTARDIEVTPVARDLARALLASRLTRGPVDDLLATGLLPAPLREAYELPWDPGRQRAFAALIQALRLGPRMVPDSLRFVVAWHQAHLRLERAAGRRGALQARVLDALDRRIDLPTSIRPIGERPGTAARR